MMAEELAAQRQKQLAELMQRGDMLGGHPLMAHPQAHPHLAQLHGLLQMKRPAPQSNDDENDLVDVDDHLEPQPKRERRTSEASDAASETDVRANEKTQTKEDGSKSPQRHTVAPSASPLGHKPRIWSIVDTATTETRSPERSPQSSPPPHLAAMGLNGHMPPMPPNAINSLIADRLFGAHASLQQKQWYAALAQNAAAQAALANNEARSQSPTASNASSTS